MEINDELIDGISLALNETEDNELESDEAESEGLAEAAARAGVSVA
jgi:hypothetical protein